MVMMIIQSTIFPALKSQHLPLRLHTPILTATHKHSTLSSRISASFQWPCATLQYPKKFSFQICKSKNGIYNIGLIEFNWRCKRSANEITNIKGPLIWKWNKGLLAAAVLLFFNSSPSSKEIELDAEVLEIEGSTNKGINKGGNFASLSRDHGWHVRRMVETDEEMRKVVRTQAEAFYEPVILFNDLFFEFFQAEVLSGLLYRLKNSPPDRYACLVAEPINGDELGSEVEDLVGVVDVTVMRDNNVLRYLPGADEYLYVSGIAVLSKFRRQKVATALLKACDTVSNLWGFDYLVLRAYADDCGAQRLYTSAGYKVVSGDPAWMTTWIGRRRRVLMIKRCEINT